MTNYVSSGTLNSTNPTQATQPVGGYTTESVTHGQCNARPTVGYLPSHRASPPIGRYQFILLGEQRHVCVNNFPRSFVKRSGRDSSLRPIGCKSDALTTAPTCHTTTVHKVKKTEGRWSLIWATWAHRAARTSAYAVRLYNGHWAWRHTSTASI